MNTQTGLRQTRFLNGILGVGLLLLGASPYGWAANNAATGELLGERSQGTVPVLSRDIDSAEESAWEAYAGMIAAATCVPSTPPEPERLALPGDPISRKVRYLSFMAGDTGRLQAVRVVFVNLPVPYDTWNGTVMWVQQPQVYCENAGVQSAPTGDDCPEYCGGLPQKWFWGAVLGCSPYYADWSALGAVHVWDEGIIPGGVYHIQMVDSTCDPGSEASFSDPLVVTMSGWGDVVKDCSTTPCGPPDGTPGIVDVTAVLDKYKNLTGNVMKARADIEGSPAGDARIPDQAINITDVTFCLGAFLGELYPPLGFPPPSPPPCGGPLYECGNWVVEPGEQCDDGNLIPGDGCDQNCQSELCGNGELDFAEECDDGVDNSDTEPDACRTNCTEARCGDNVIDTGEECDDGNTTPGDGCDDYCLVEPFVGDAVITLRIMGNNPSGSLDPGVTLDGNQMTLPGVGHQVFLELYSSDWDPGMTGLSLKSFQFAIDSNGYSSGLTGAITPWRPPCGNDADCIAVMGPVGGPMDALKGGCNLPGLPPNVCAAGFADGARIDFIFYGQAYLGAVDQSTIEYRYGATLLGLPIESPHIGDMYVGTLVLDVPTDAVGTFTIDFKPGAQNTILTDENNQLIPLGGIEPAVIIVQTDCCLPNGSCATSMSVEDCQADGGTPVPECAGADINGDGIDDACGDTACCLGDGSCTELPMADCISQPGTPTCACLGDLDPVNGVDDACEPCAVAGTALAEPMACSENAHCGPQPPGGGRGGSCVDGICECSIDDDCWNLASCISGVCYAPKNRYITFEPNNAGRCVAFQVDMTSCDTFPGCTFTKKWVGPPNPITGVSRVVDTAVYRDWTEPVINVADLEIVPASTYEIRAIEQACDPDDPTKYSPPLILTTVPKPTICADSCVTPCHWGDIVGIQVPPGVYLPPDGKIDFDDIVAMIEAILEDPNAPPITWTDLMREVPNVRIDIRDLIAIDDACRKGQPYPGASPCETTTVDQPWDGAEVPSTSDVTCRLFDAGTGYLLIQDTRDRWQAIPSQSVDVDLFIANVDELRAYQVKVVATRALGGVESLIPCEGGVQINVSHQVCAGTHENCLYENDCKWCVGGSNNELPCTDDLDCPDGGTCEDGPKICVGGDRHREPCVNDSECTGAGALCKACAYDFAFSMAPGGHTSYIRCSRLEVGAASDATDLGDRPPGYLGTYLLEIPDDAGCSTFEIYIVPEDEMQEETTFFLTPAQTANDDSIPYFTDEPCARFKVLFDCNKNGIPDECDIGDEEMCATDLCQAYAGQEECGQSNNCNNNEYPDECEITEDPDNHPDEFFCSETCVGCTADCICLPSRDACPEGCNYVTGEGCPEGCDPECMAVDAVCDPDCQPDGQPGHGIPDECDIAGCAGDPDLCDCNENEVPDKCDITEGDAGYCLEDCSWDCQPNQTPDECEDDCSDDGCPDDCEYRTDRPVEQSCGQPVAEEDCDSDGMCNVDEISEDNNGACTSENCSSDCHFYCYDPEVYKAWCDPYVGIPDECDIRDCPGCNPEDPDCYEEDCWDCDGNGVPDWCDINIGCESSCCADCNENRHPDGCDLNPNDPDGDGLVSPDCQSNGVPDECDMNPGAGGESCDVNGNDVPDECDVVDHTLDLECPACDPYPYCATCNSFELAGVDEFPMGGAFTIRWLNGDPDTVLSVSSDGQVPPTVFDRGAPHLHGDIEADTPLTGDPCMAPPGFPTNANAGHEVHVEIVSLNLVGDETSVELNFAAEPGLGYTGEAQGSCLDFPADSFFNVFLELNTGSVTLHSDTPITVRAELTDFVWDYTWDYAASTTTQRRAVYANDHSAPAVPLFDANGIQRAYLVRAQLGQDEFVAESESCETAPGLFGAARISFAVDGLTDGVLIPPSTSNRVCEDAGSAPLTVTVYRSLGDIPDGWTPPWINTNDWVPHLKGDMGTGGFVVGDAINSLSYGRDGTGGATSSILYFSVDGSSEGEDCTDVNRAASIGGADRDWAAADAFMATVAKTFGAYDAGFLSPPCTQQHGNCLLIDQTAFGLGPLLVDLPGQENSGLYDNVVALEISEFTEDWAYFTFRAIYAPLAGQETTIFVYHDTGGLFGYDALNTYVNLGDGGLGFLQADDVIDALAVSDVGGTMCADGTQCTEDSECVGHGTPEVCTMVWSPGDEVLFSLDPDSPGLEDLASLCGGSTCSPADIFRLTHPSALTRFISASGLGLLATDNVDAIDVGGTAFMLDEANDCNENAITDGCDLERRFSADANVNDRLDDCEPLHLAPSSPPMLAACCPVGTPARGSTIRYLAFEAGDAGRQQALRVTIKDAPPLFEHYIGQGLWVGQPFEVCENAGESEPPPEGCGASPGLPSSFMAAELECRDLDNPSNHPLFMDWHGACTCGVCVGGLTPGKACVSDSDCLGTLYVYHEAIIPSGGLHNDQNSFSPAVYGIEVIDAACSLADPDAYSDFLDFTMSKWGDAVKNCGTIPCGPPDGIVNVTTDVTAVLDKYKNLPNAVLKVRADVEGCPKDPPGCPVPDQVVNITDVTYCLDAFLGFPYPFDPVPEGPCP